MGTHYRTRRIAALELVSHRSQNPPERKLYGGSTPPPGTRLKPFWIIRFVAMI